MLEISPNSIIALAMCYYLVYVLKWIWAWHAYCSKPIGFHCHVFCRYVDTYFRDPYGDRISPRDYYTQRRGTPDRREHSPHRRYEGRFQFITMRSASHFLNSHTEKWYNHLSGSHQLLAFCDISYSLPICIVSWYCRWSISWWLSEKKGGRILPHVGSRECKVGIIAMSPSTYVIVKHLFPHTFPCDATTQWMYLVRPLLFVRSKSSISKD